MTRNPFKHLGSLLRSLSRLRATLKGANNLGDFCFGRLNCHLYIGFLLLLEVAFSRL